MIMVFIRTNPFKDVPQYRNAINIGLLSPTNNTLRVSEIVRAALKEIFIPGIEIKKAGVVLSQITDDAARQQNFLEPTQPSNLMKTIDQINAKYGRDSIHLANTKRFLKKRQSPKWVSPQYTTNWQDLLVI